MKTLLMLLLFTLAALSQETNQPPANYAIKFWGPSNQWNFPQYWPSSVQTVGTNTTAPEGWTFFTPEGYADLIATNKAAYAIAKSNKVWTLSQTFTANVGALQTLYDKIPQGLTLGESIAASSVVIENSLASGTNTQAQLVTRIRQLNANANDLVTIQTNVLQLLQKLGPVLRTVYQKSL